MASPKLIDLGFETRELTVSQVLARQVRRHRDKTFLHFLPDDRRYSYGEVDRLSNRLANGLAALGIGQGEHVAIVMDNSPEHLLLALALGKLGAVAVPVNTACRGQLLQYYLAQSRSVHLVIDGIYLERARELGPVFDALRSVVVLGPHEPWGGNGHSLERLLEAGDDTPPAADVRFCDDAYIAYTSGTTGPSKGNLLSQAASLSFGLSNAEHHGFRESDVLYICLPLFHVNAMQSSTYAALTAGASVAMTTRFSTSRYWDDVRRAGATVTNMLGSMVNFLWSQPERPDDVDNGLRIVSVVPTPRFAQGFEQRFGLRIVSSFGMSDYGMATVYSVNDPPAKLGSAGRARTLYDVRIVDDDDFPLPAGETGEIALRCTEPWRVASGYFDKADATLDSRRNLFFHTGDRGYLDDEGYLWFVDRKKDAIRRRGENISAFEVEQIIGLHPAVAEVAAFPVRAETAEDEVAAAIVLKPGQHASPEQIIEFCVGNMSYFMVPRFLQFRAEFPRTLSQKIQKHLLKEEIEHGTGGAWDRERAGIVVKR